MLFPNTILKIIQTFFIFQKYPLYFFHVVTWTTLSVSLCMGIFVNEICINNNLKLRTCDARAKPKQEHRLTGKTELSNDSFNCLITWQPAQPVRETRGTHPDRASKQSCGLAKLVPLFIGNGRTCTCGEIMRSRARSGFCSSDGWGASVCVGNRLGRWRRWEEGERAGILKTIWGANDLGGLTVDWIQQRQGKFDRECTCGWAGYTCALLSVGSIENGAPRRIHMSSNNREGQVG